MAIELIDRLGPQMCHRQGESSRNLGTPLRRHAPVFGPSHVCSRIIISARGLFLLLSTCEASLARARLKISELAAVPAPPSQYPSQYPPSLNGNSSFLASFRHAVQALIVLRPQIDTRLACVSRNGVLRVRAGVRTKPSGKPHRPAQHYPFREHCPKGTIDLCSLQVATNVHICFARQHCRHRNKSI